MGSTEPGEEMNHERFERLIRIMNDNAIATGHTDILDALAHAEEMRTALRVIHTWAGVPGALDARHVRELTAKALHMPSNAELRGRPLADGPA